MNMNTLAIQCRYRKSPYESEMCGLRVLETCILRWDKSTWWGLFLLRLGGPTQVGLLWIVRQQSPHCFQVCRASPINTSSPPPLQRDGWLLEEFLARVGKIHPLSESKCSSGSSLPSLFFTPMPTKRDYDKELDGITWWARWGTSQECL